MLNGAHRFVAPDFDAVNGVLTAPLQQHLQLPLRQPWVLVSVERGRCSLIAAGIFRIPSRQDILVAGHHVKVGSRKVALPLVVGFEAGARVALKRADSQFAVAACRGELLAIVLAIRMIISDGVHIGIHRIKVIQVGAGPDVGAATKPALRHRVLTRIDVFLVGATLLGVCSACALLVVAHLIVGDVGISVANGHAVVQDISRGIGSPDAVEPSRAVFDLLELLPLIGSVHNLEHGRL